MGRAVFIVCMVQISIQEQSTQLYLVLEVLDADLLPALQQLVVCPADDLTLHDGGAVCIQLWIVMLIIQQMMGMKSLPVRGGRGCTLSSAAR